MLKSQYELKNSVETKNIKHSAYLNTGTTLQSPNKKEL